MDMEEFSDSFASNLPRGDQAGDLSSLEGSDMEYVVLPSSDGEYDDTDLEEEIFPGQTEDGALDYYGDYNDQIPYDFEHPGEHVYGDGHVEDEYEDDQDDDDDDDDEDNGEEAAYYDEDLYDDVDSEDEEKAKGSYSKKFGKRFRFYNCYLMLKIIPEYNPEPLEDPSSED
ncbi:acidic leucine-rich nuclear phosphoprotein 32 family member B-like [Papaver somniferum]|uniref:acidic leucine-rich nuclear phosphoprotein 32 family member B-like n=1 Tax=Papaver somniferum TaxID=3469 RepID=UPI000E6F4F0B|nr:acidic leucine-rich nuclear phosphoprotein 32 family member B-like [Papaver somniferum]